MKSITILIPTKDRPTALAATLTSLLTQTYFNFTVIISDQGKGTTIATIPTFQTLKRIFSEKGITITYLKHLPERGIAEQREFLLNQALSPYALYLDDDVILEPFVVQILWETIQKEHCGFVEQAVIGLSFLHNIRMHEQHIEFWKKNVKPEKIRPHDVKWNRYLLHNGANMYHVQQHAGVTVKRIKKYKVSWIGGCVMYDIKKLKGVGGFSFWKNMVGVAYYHRVHIIKNYQQQFPIEK